MALVTRISKQIAHVICRERCVERTSMNVHYCLIVKPNVQYTVEVNSSLATTESDTHPHSQSNPYMCPYMFMIINYMHHIDGWLQSMKYKCRRQPILYANHASIKPVHCRLSGKKRNWKPVTMSAKRQFHKRKLSGESKIYKYTMNAR